jgi:hypothetical protein
MLENEVKEKGGMLEEDERVRDIRGDRKGFKRRRDGDVIGAREGY